MGNNKYLMSKEEVAQRLEEFENFDLSTYITETDDGKQILDFQRLINDTPAKPTKSVAPQKNGSTRITFYNGQSVTFAKDGLISKAKTKKNKK